MRQRKNDDCDLHPIPIIEALDRHGVRYIAIGSYPAILQDVDLSITDLDIVPDVDFANAEGLRAALTDLGAREKRWGGAETGYDFLNDPSTLTDQKFWQFETPYGDLDIVLAPAGFPAGYEDLIGKALVIPLEDESDPRHSVQLVMADKRDIYESKRLAGRRKDLEALPQFVGIHPEPAVLKETIRARYQADLANRTTPESPSHPQSPPVQRPRGPSL